MCAIFRWVASYDYTTMHLEWIFHVNWLDQPLYRTLCTLQFVGSFYPLFNIVIILLLLQVLNAWYECAPMNTLLSSHAFSFYAVPPRTDVLSSCCHYCPHKEEIWFTWFNRYSHCVVQFDVVCRWIALHDHVQEAVSVPAFMSVQRTTQWCSQSVYTESLH